MKKEFDKTIDYQKAKDKALSYLSFRAHSKKEIKEKLLRYGATEDIICDVVDFLEEYKLINEEDFALMYAKDLKNLKRYGERRIKMELSKKGISPEIIENTLLELGDYDDSLLYELIKKRLKGDFDKKNKDRVIRYFITKGYELDEIKKNISIIESE